MNTSDIDKAIELLQQGKVVILPTETVYGLAVRYDFQDGVDKIFELKNRPHSKPLSLAFHSEEQIQQFLGIKIQFDLTQPTTWLVSTNKVYGVHSLQLRNITKYIGIRLPNHTTYTTIAKKISVPLCLTSANLSDESPAITAEEARRIFPNLLTIDGGECKFKSPSKVLKYEN